MENLDEGMVSFKGKSLTYLNKHGFDFWIKYNIK